MTLPAALDLKLIGVVQAGPGLGWNCQAPFTTGAAALSMLEPRLTGTVGVEYNWILLPVELVLVPCTNHWPDVALIFLH